MRQAFIRSGRAWVVAIAVALTGSAHAQVDQLPPTVVGSLNISAGAQAQIDAFVAARAPELTDADFTRVKRARDALLAPLGQPNVSVAFRQAYGRALWPHISALLDAEPIQSRLTGMRLAGAVGTEEPAARLIELLGSEDDGIRVFAAQRLGPVLQHAGKNSAGVSPETAARVIDALGAMVRDEPVLSGADVAVRSLGVGAQLPAAVLGNARDRAIAVLAQSAGARMARVNQRGQESAKEMLIALRAAGIVRDAVSETPPSPETAKAVMGFGADTLAAVVRTLRGTSLAPGELTAEIRIVRAAEGVVYFARRPTEPTLQPTNFAALLEKERGTRDFQNEVIRFLGQGSPLARYGFAPDRFISG